MSRVVRSFNGAGQLLLRGGDVLPGRYHVDVSYLPVRRIHETQGRFVLNDPPAWETVVEAQFAGDARIAMTDGREAHVRLGGILGGEVAILALETEPDA